MEFVNVNLNTFSSFIIIMLSLAQCFQGCHYGRCTKPSVCSCYNGWSGNSCAAGQLCMHNIYLLNHLLSIIATDINECSEGTSGCSQICENLRGSYNCSCFSGYNLQTNGHTCQG